MTINKTIHRLAILALAVALAATACSDGAQQPEPFFDPGSGSQRDPDPASGTLPPVEEIDATAPLPEAGELQGLLDDLIANSDLPALGVTVFDGDEIIEAAVTGVRRSGDPTPVEPTDLFHIGSNAKAMTATLVATYVDEGVISWETTVGNVYEDVLPALDADLAQVTFRQLLSHTAGFDDERVVLNLEGIDDDLPVMDQRHEAATITLARPGDLPAGEFMYSNVGYTIVGAMLEELTGTPWEELLRTRIFDVLGMDSCGFYAPGTPGEVDQPWGHLDEQGGQAIDPGHPEADYPRVIAPAGLVHCSMSDWALFLQSQLRGFQGSDTEIISPDSFAALQTAPDGSTYALGWDTIQTPNGLVIHHHGSNNRFTAYTLLFPAENWAMLVVTNLGEEMADPTIGAVVDALVMRRVLASGENVDIGGREMFVACHGSGSPTVILEHGLGTTGADFKTVQDTIADTTRVCYTSRAGMGFSDPIQGGVRTAQDAADDLSAVLAAADVPGPYVVVGHSFGGLVVRLFADQHPDDVVGMVLVDSTHEDQLTRMREEMSPQGWAEVSVFFGPDNAENMDLDASVAQVAAAGDLGNMPLVVLGAGQEENEDPPPGIAQAAVDELNAVMGWLGPELQLDLANLSTNGRYLLVEGSGHFIHLDRPDAVIDAINSVLGR